MKMGSQETLVAVAGQPNSGKSSIFNLLTGARQHVANYPGVTVEKKTGTYKFKNKKVRLVDLPGTYSLTSYTTDEQIARDFLLYEKPNVVVDIVDASNLERNLYLVFQLCEIGVPLVIALNMSDIARRRGFKIDIDKLSKRLGVKIVPTVGNRGKGKKELRDAIESVSEKSLISPFHVDYGETLEFILNSLELELANESKISGCYPLRWLAIKFLEGDPEARRIVKENAEKAVEIFVYVAEQREKLASRHKTTPEKVIAYQRYKLAKEIVDDCLTRKMAGVRTLSDKIDMVICNRFTGPIILALTIYALYEFSIVQGYNLTNYTWPVLALFRNFIASLLPFEGFIFDPLSRSMPLGVIDGIAAVLNYVPIFVILFALIAIMEDTGYLARMSFILDRVFRYFGLHGQSILPLVLSGLYVGGCAIPGVMACRGIKDEKARMATIMIAPLMNCLAKVPLYTFLLGIFFVENKGIMMFFIATITIIIALGVAKILNLTIFRKKLTAPFILEMPAYHIPTLNGVLRRCLERVWIFVKKITTIVAIVMVFIYFLIHFPSINNERKTYYQNQADEIKQTFYKKIGQNNPYQELLSGERLIQFISYSNDYKKAKMSAKTKEAKKAIDQKFKKKNFEFFKVVNRGKYTADGKKITDKNAKKVEKAYKKLEKARRRLRGNLKEEIIIGSVMGRAGRSIEPLTRFAGFNWRVNIALISSFAAKENSVATLGAIYESPMEGGETKKLEERVREKEKDWTPLHAIAIILFMAMYPPCIPTLLMVRLETGSTKWMLFATIYPLILGGILAFLAFTVGGMLGLSGLQAMIAIYVLTIVVTTMLGFIKVRPGI